MMATRVLDKWRGIRAGWQQILGELAEKGEIDFEDDDDEGQEADDAFRGLGSVLCSG